MGIDVNVRVSFTPLRVEIVQASVLMGAETPKTVPAPAEQAPAQNPAQAEQAPAPAASRPKREPAPSTTSTSPPRMTTTMISVNC